MSVSEQQQCRVYLQYLVYISTAMLTVVLALVSSLLSVTGDSPCTNLTSSAPCLPRPLVVQLDLPPDPSVIQVATLTLHA